MLRRCLWWKKKKEDKEKRTKEHTKVINDTLPAGSKCMATTEKLYNHRTIEGIKDTRA